MLDEGVGAPGAEAGGGGDDPVTLADGGDGRAGGEDLEAALVAGDGGGLGGAEEGGVGGLGAIGALDGVDVGRVDGGGEGADEDGMGGDRGGYGVGVEAASVYQRLYPGCSIASVGTRQGGVVLEGVDRLAWLREDEGLGLRVAVGSGLAPDGRGAEGPAGETRCAGGPGAKQCCGEATSGSEGRHGEPNDSMTASGMPLNQSRASKTERMSSLSAL